MNKVIAFIDAGQFRPGVVMPRMRTVGKRFDWRMFKAFLDDQFGTLQDHHYFDCQETHEGTRQESFHNFLRSALSMQVHLSELRQAQKTCPQCGKAYTVNEQKGVDVNIAVNIMVLAYNGGFDHAVICSGDGDFAPLVRFLRGQLGKRVSIVGWRGGIAPSLMEAANRTIILNDYTDELFSQDVPKSPVTV